MPEFEPCATTHTIEYMFGHSFVVAPIFEPGNGPSGVVDKEVWIPPGRWIRWQAPSQATLQGPRQLTQQFTNAEMAVFAREGAIIPLKGLDAMHQVAPLTLTLQVILSPTTSPSSGNTTIYEDDGETLLYTTTSAFRRIFVTQTSNATATVVNIRPCAEDAGFIGERKERIYEVQLLCGNELRVTHVFVNGIAKQIGERTFGPNNVQTSIVSSGRVEALRAMEIVAHYGMKVDANSRMRS